MPTSFSSRPPFIFCICPDSFLALRYTSDCIKKFYPTWNLNEHLYTFWADEDLSPFWEKLETHALFSSQTILVLRNSHTLPDEIWKKISSALSHISSDVWPFFFFETPFEKGKPKIPAHIYKVKCWDFAQKNHLVWQYPGLGRTSIRKYILSASQNKGLALTTDALDVACERFPYEASGIEGELEKLFLFSFGKAISAEVLLNSLDEPQYDIFALLSNLQEGQNLPKIWHTIITDQIGDISFFGFAALLARETRILWQLLHDEMTPIPLAIAVKKKSIAKRIGLKKISRIWEALYFSELQVKKGNLTPQQALEGIIGAIIAIFAV